MSFNHIVAGIVGEIDNLVEKLRVNGVNSILFGEIMCRFKCRYITVNSYNTVRHMVNRAHNRYTKKHKHLVGL